MTSALCLLSAGVGSSRLWAQAQNRHESAARTAVSHRSRAGEGNYTVRWDGRDDDGRTLASGVYLYRLRAGKQQVETWKLLLIR